eukprot:15711879-Heterocapsa_arctica.AAC.1
MLRSLALWLLCASPAQGVLSLLAILLSSLWFAGAEVLLHVVAGGSQMDMHDQRGWSYAMHDFDELQAHVDWIKGQM